MNQDSILTDVSHYYTDKLTTHGPSPKGMDWKDRESQFLRFDQLLKIRSEEGAFRVIDFGCGLGCLSESIAERGWQFDYHGIDVSPHMISTAQQRHGSKVGIHFYTSPEEPSPQDYVLGSGIFNVRMQYSDAEWEDYLVSTLDTFNRLSTRGFGFNLLTSFSDANRKRPDLYYADPAKLFNLCKERYSKHVALLHDYPLYEFTLLVRKVL